MGLENSAGNEATLALIAFVGLLPSMAADVLFQVTAFLKGGGAVIAAKWAI